MTRKFLRYGTLVLGAAALLTLSSCEKDDDEEENEEEVITTLQLNFAPVGGGNTLQYSFDDPDGPGGNNPTIQTIDLAPNRQYNVTVQVLNKTENPVEDKTSEIRTEGTSHRFFYAPNPTNIVTIANLDADANGVPLGLSSTWTTSNAATGTIRVTLRHYGGNPPNKQTTDPVDSPKSSTDIEATFPIRVQ
mgnify:CR=1 FL=1